MFISYIKEVYTILIASLVYEFDYWLLFETIPKLITVRFLNFKMTITDSGVSRPKEIDIVGYKQEVAVVYTTTQITIV